MCLMLHMGKRAAGAILSRNATEREEMQDKKQGKKTKQKGLLHFVSQHGTAVVAGSGYN